MNETLGRIHFWGSLVAMNGIFFPMLIQGLPGVSRRLLLMEGSLIALLRE